MQKEDPRWTHNVKVELPCGVTGGNKMHCGKHGRGYKCYLDGDLCHLEYGDCFKLDKLPPKLQNPTGSGSDALLSASEAVVAGLYDGIYGGDSEYIRLSAPYAKELIKELEKVVAIIKSR